MEDITPTGTDSGLQVTWSENKDQCAPVERIVISWSYVNCADNSGIQGNDSVSSAETSYDITVDQAGWDVGVVVKAQNSKGEAESESVTGTTKSKGKINTCPVFFVHCHL